jgi:hypothetical protein
LNLKKAHYFVATSYRVSISKWRGIEEGRALNEVKTDFIETLIMGLI